MMKPRARTEKLSWSSSLWSIALAPCHDRFKQQHQIQHRQDQQFYVNHRYSRRSSTTTTRSLFATALFLSVGVSTWSMWWIWWGNSNGTSSLVSTLYNRHDNAAAAFMASHLNGNEQKRHRKLEDSMTTVDLAAEAAAATTLSYSATEKEINTSSRNIVDDTTSTAQRHIGTRSAMEKGILSKEDGAFFGRIQDAIDAADPAERCARYGWTYNATKKRQRKIFFGALIASEPLELLHIVATETYGIYSGMVFVESNRTQSFVPRSFQHLDDAPFLSNLFGVSGNDNEAQQPLRVQVRPYFNENRKVQLLTREHRQRAEILRGWQELGMQPDDVGIIADADETWTRDILRAMQTCDDIVQFDYTQHYCRHDRVKLTAHTRIYEASPLCLTSNRGWFHPDAIIGHCIKGIGNATSHGVAPRDTPGSYTRARGFGHHCSDWDGEANLTQQAIQQGNQTSARFPLWNAADFRRTCSGPQIQVRTTNSTSPNIPTAMPRETDPLLGSNETDQHDNLEPYTGFHFHNFFASIDSTRFKYATYGHADRDADHTFIGNLSLDLQMMHRCVLDLPDTDIATGTDHRWKRHVGDFETVRPFVPIYFYDSDYRRRRHAFVKDMVVKDEESMPRVNAASEATRIALTDAAIPKRKRRSRWRSRRSSREPTTHKDTLRPTKPQTHGDGSSHATVIALATNYELKTYQRFVGSLRRSGYTGHVILGLQPNPLPDVLDYLHSRHVTVKQLSWVNCTYTMAESASDIFQKTKCAHPYPDIKIRWSRFPLARDWLAECTTCTGPVLLTDARDVLFQRDPFGTDAPPVNGLQVFQEDPAMTTQNWLTQWPIRECKNATYDAPMLCSGTTVGTREAMLRYLEIIYQEMKVWIEDPKCRFNINGDDQSIHNYLFYSGRLPFATSIANRRGGIVNTIGHAASSLFKRHIKPFVLSTNQTSLSGRIKRAHRKIRYPGATESTWIGVELNMTNEDGLLVELDGSISRVLHQWDRFGFPFSLWLDHQPWGRDDSDPKQPAVLL